MVDTNKEILNELRDFWETMDGKFPGLVDWKSDFAVKLSKHHDDIGEEIHKFYAPLIYTLDESLQWLSKFYDLFESCFDKEPDENYNNRFIRSYLKKTSKTH